MKDFIDFLYAALPWLCIGLLLAVFFAQSARRKKDNKKKITVMNNKWTLLIVTIIMTSLICVSCNQQQVIPKQLDIEVVDGDEISFNIGIDDFVTQFNYLYDD